MGLQKGQGRRETSPPSPLPDLEKKKEKKKKQILNYKKYVNKITPT